MNLQQFNDLFDHSSESCPIYFNKYGQVVMPHHDYRYSAFSSYKSDRGHHTIHLKDHQRKEGSASGLCGTVTDALQFIAVRVVYDF